eukprot:1048952-Ditylum_brightwellii.AAC.1
MDNFESSIGSDDVVEGVVSIGIASDMVSAATSLSLDKERTHDDGAPDEKSALHPELNVNELKDKTNNIETASLSMDCNNDDDNDDDIDVGDDRSALHYELDGNDLKWASNDKVVVEKSNENSNSTEHEDDNDYSNESAIDNAAAVGDALSATQRADSNTAEKDMHIHSKESTNTNEPEESSDAA